ncbi:ATP-binding protein [Burkholderia sp. BCC1644]|uniref:ATP-binding protein n=1 Tax=Burkholderia sp. BCC1644 TaxID=2676293 RepID=UPI0015927985|nr:ATP-binding protein [Burkholderia sp. BCC1644]
MNALDIRAPLTHQGQALESSRDSGFDLSAAIGEPVDNSFEAGASIIRIGTLKASDGSISDIGIADNGGGIPLEILPNVLSVGYSSRYNSRKGLGRFGMGLKLAALSQGRRAEIYTKARGETTVYRTVLDLEDVQAGTQEYLYVEDVGTWPNDFEGLMRHPETNEPFGQGTLVVWRKIDRLRRGGHYGEGVDQRISDLTKFLARAYRRFIDAGLYIDLDGTEVTLHDPLFILNNPRVEKRVGKDARAKIIQQDEFIIDGHKVTWTVSLLPEEVRKDKGVGGRGSARGREDFKDLYIPDNEGKLSILRNGREIYYEIVPKLLPHGVDIVDRFIGIEVSFPAELDEYFQVRNVKRGAEPVLKLREQLRTALSKPVAYARKEVRRYWGEVEQQKSLATGDNHVPAHEAVDQFERTAPQGQAGFGDPNPEAVDKTMEELADDLELDVSQPEDREKVKWIRKSFEERALTVVDAGWPGKELIDIRHLHGKAIVKFNTRHPFFAEMVLPLKNMAAQAPDELSVDDVSALLKKLSSGIDLLLLAYAKAENMHREPEEAYGELRSHWGLFTSGLIRELTRNG